MKKFLQEKGIFKIIILCVVLLIPVIYSFFYLKSYWDPYGNLNGIKVGIVNLDEGKRGAELITNLKENENSFDFTEIELKDSVSGLENDEYYAVITIPEDFTKRLESGGEQEKQKTTIVFTPNKRKNYLSYQIINSGLKTAEIELQSKVSSEIANTMADKLKEVPDSIDEIDNGVGQIKDGAVSLTSGLSQLSDGVNVLDTKYSEFDDGVKTIAEGSATLTDGITKAGNGIDELHKGATSLDEGVTQINEALDKADTSKITTLTDGITALNTGVNGEQGLANGLNSYIDGVHTYEDKIEAGASELETGLTQYIAGVNTLDQNQDQILQGLVNYCSALENAGAPVDSTLAQLAAGAKQILNAPSRSTLSTAETKLKAGANGLANAKNTSSFDELTNGETALKAGMTKIAGGITQLNNSKSQIQSLGNSINTLQDSMSQVQDGTGKLRNGLGQLSTETKKIQNGSTTLSNGLDELSSNSSLIKTALQKSDNGMKSALNGGNKLKDGIYTLKNSIEEGNETTIEEVTKLDGIEEYVEDPVEFKEETFGEVESYGVAFTPLFLSIGLWVGGLMLYVILYYDQKHRFGILDHENKNKILQNFIYIGIGALEGLITGITLKVLLGYTVSDIGIYVFECVLVGMLFTTIMQFLIRNFGDIGKFIALIILVLQLAASGGTFPVETIDKHFQIFTSWLPMTYTIRIFKDCLIPTNASLINENTIILISLFIVLIVINTIIEFIKIKKEQKSVENK